MNTHRHRAAGKSERPRHQSPLERIDERLSRRDADWYARRIQAVRKILFGDLDESDETEEPLQ